MGFFKLPIIDAPAQRFKMDLGGQDFFIRLDFNNLDLLWRISIFTTDEIAVFTGRVVLLGVDLLKGTDIKGILHAEDTTGEGIEADFDGLISERVVMTFADSIQ